MRDDLAAGPRRLQHNVHPRGPLHLTQLIFALRTYVETLASSGGGVPEFVNPKYSDSARTHFKSPTRLECMMQDLPWLMPGSSKISFTTLDAALFYSPVKNSLQDAVKKAAAGQSPCSASTGEHAIFHLNVRLMELAGAALGLPESRSISGVPLQLGPMVVLTSDFRPSFATAINRMRGTIKVS